MKLKRNRQSLKAVASRSTRNKIRFQAKSARDDLRHAMDHMIELAALADDNSGYINETLPPIITTLELVIKTYDQFKEGL